MSRGKYSPNCPHAHDSNYKYEFNCYGQVAEPWTQEMYDAGLAFDPKTMDDNYDSEGYDSYGYSCFDADGEYVGSLKGIDRDGWTEMDYLLLNDLSEYERETYYD